MLDEPIRDVRTVRLGLELRRIRLERNLTLQTAHELLMRSVSSISRIEKGQVKLPERDLPPILNAYGITDPVHREALLALVRNPGQDAWWEKYSKGLTTLPDMISLENEASRIRAFEALVVPGLLQTPRYASALFATNRDIPHHRAQRAVTVRVHRQGILDRRDPPILHVIMLEGVLRQVVGGPEVMTEQLHHLATIAKRDHIKIQVVPFRAGGHRASNSFAMLTVPSLSGHVVHIDTSGRAMVFDHADEVRRYAATFEALQGLACSESKTVELIEQVAADLAQ